MILTAVSMPESLGLSVLGMLVVFAVLILLMGAISVLSIVMGKINKTDTVTEPSSPAPSPAAPAVKLAAAPGSCGDIKLHSVSVRQAAMIMAIVADELEVPLNTLRFKSICEIEEGDVK